MVRDPLARVVELLEVHLPDRGRLVLTTAGCEVFALPGPCGGSTVTVVAAGSAESVSHVCGVDVEALR